MYPHSRIPDAEVTEWVIVDLSKADARKLFSVLEGIEHMMDAGNVETPKR